MATVGAGSAYATDIILAQLVFYKQDFGILFQLVLVVSTQSLGYGIAGMMRKFLGESSYCSLLISIRHESLIGLPFPSVSGLYDLAW